MDDSFNVTGKLRLELKNISGNIVDSREVPNLVVASGKEHIASRIARVGGIFTNTGSTQVANLDVKGNITSVMNCIALGNSTSVVVVGDTDLEGAGGVEMGRAVFSGISRTANAITYTSVIGAGTATGTVRTAGIFNNVGPNTGNMLCRTTFADLTKGGSDSLTVTWIINIL